MSPATRSWNPVKEKVAPDTLNKAGAPAYSETAEFELADILLSSFGKEDAYYESGEEKFQRLKGLLTKVTPEYCAQLALMARRQFHMRNLPNFCCAFVLLSRPNAPWKRHFFANYPVRADDPLEIMGAAEAILGQRLKKFPHFLKKGFGAYLGKLDAYQLAKYSVNTAHKQKSSRWNLVDLVNLCHPPHTPALEALVKGTLAKADTHEASVTAKVQEALASATEENYEEIKAEAKREDWERLLIDGRLGYMALLKNVRNILQNGVNDQARQALFAQLTDPERIAKSRVLPFRYLSAYKALQALGGHLEGVSGAMVALSNAVAISLGNVPDLPGKTVCLVDESGSMMITPINARKGRMEEWMKIYAGEIGMLFAAALAAKGADTILFGDSARQVRINPANSLFSAVDLLPRHGQGTNLPAALNLLSGKYDRIIIQHNGNTGKAAKAFDQIKWCEQDRNGLVEKIKSIDLNGKLSWT